MARAAEKLFFWEASSAADVETYLVYVEPEATPVTYDSPSTAVGLVTSVDLGELANSGFAPLVNAEGNFNLGVSAVDGAGNESDIAVLTAVPLDFVPPTPPTGLGVS